jgi:hypothetical protein
MAKPRKPLPGDIIGEPHGWTPAGEADHFMRCPDCGEVFDTRDLGQVFDHIHDGPEAKSGRNR